MLKIALRDRECPHCQSVIRTIDGASLRQHRKEAGLSLREVARRMGITAAYLSDLELNRRLWSMDKADKFLRALRKGGRK